MDSVALGDKVWWWQQNIIGDTRRSHAVRGTVVRIARGGVATMQDKDGEEHTVAIKRLKADDRS